MKKPLEVVKKDVARFRLSVRGFCYLFGLLTRNNDASAMPRHTLLRTTAHVRRAAVATVVEQLMFVACLGSQQARTTDTQRELIFRKSQSFWLGQTNWAYFRPNYQHPFWYCESFVHFFHYSTIISTKS
jgi:hypothetical protein